jgi:hypothetical protein
MLPQTEKIQKMLLEYKPYRQQECTAALVQLDALESVLKSLKEKATDIAPDYPNIAECEPYEQLYAIQASCEGTSTANDARHKVIDVLRQRLGMSKDELLALWKEVMC